LTLSYLDASVEPVGTVLCGELADLAAVQGLLARLEIFGARVTEVRCVHQHPGPAMGSGPDD